MSDMREKEVQEALNFLKKEGLSEVIDKFIASEDFSKLVSENYERLLKDVEEIQRNVPENFKKEAIEYWDKSEYSIEAYKTDVTYTLVTGIYSACIYMQEYFKENWSVTIMLEAIDQNMQTESIKILKATKKACSDAYFCWIYSNYIPADVPEDIVYFLRTMGNGMIIPVTALFPELDEVD